MEFTWDIQYNSKEEKDYSRIGHLEYTVGERIVPNIRKSRGFEATVDEATKAIEVWVEKYIAELQDPSYNSLDMQGNVDYYHVLIASEDMSLCLYAEVKKLTDKFEWIVV